MNDNRFYKLHIFSAGTHKSASGHSCTLTQDDLSNTADVFISNHRVPLCLGHSSYKKKDVLPSMGWFRAVKEEDGQLYGLLEATAAGKALIEGGYYENFSASFYAPDSPLNPKPGTWTLRHVAALGEEPPALKELDPMLEIIPEDFSEVQDFNLFYEFKSADSDDFEEFSDGSTELLPDTFEFKTFRKFSNRFNCKPGNKSCKGRCIPNNWKCRETSSKKFEPGTKKEYKKPQQKQNNTLKPQENKFLSKEDYKVQKDAEKKEAAKKKVEHNVTIGNIKGIAAGAVLVGSAFMAETSFPNNKQAKAATKIISSIVADQIVIKNDASLNDRMRSVLYGSFRGGLNFGIEEVLGDNPAAKTMASATTGMMDQLLIKSGLVPMDHYDSYAKGLMAATETFGGAIQDVRKFKKKQSEVDKWTAKQDEQIAKAKANVDELTEAQKRVNRSNDERFEDINERLKRAARSRDLSDAWIISFMDLMREAHEHGFDSEGFLRKYNTAAESMQIAGITRNSSQSFSEADVHRSSSNYGKKGNLYYPNSDVPIKFTRSESLAAIYPLMMAIALELGLISKKDISKAYAKPVKAGNPELDAVFSEMKSTKKIIHHETENEDLFRALFGDKRLVTESEIEELDAMDHAFSEESGGSVGRKRRRKRSGSNNFSEKGTKKTRRRETKQVLSIDNLITDAIASAESSMEESFSEGENSLLGRRSRKTNPKGNRRSKKQKAIETNFAERKIKPRRKRVRMMDFSEQQPQATAESAEMRRLRKELAQEKLRGRRLEVENFAESLYDSGKLTQGFARKKDLVNFLMKQNKDSGSFDFGEGSTSGDNDYDFVVNLLTNIEPMVSFSEVVEDATIVPMPKFEDGYDLQSQKLDYQINLLMQANPELTYSDAWAKVAGGTLR